MFEGCDGVKLLLHRRSIGFKILPNNSRVSKISIGTPKPDVQYVVDLTLHVGILDVLLCYLHKLTRSFVVLVNSQATPLWENFFTAFLRDGLEAYTGRRLRLGFTGG